jgi:hypothetical protein
MLAHRADVRNGSKTDIARGTAGSSRGRNRIVECRDCPLDPGHA